MTPLGKEQNESFEEHNIILMAPLLHKDTGHPLNRNRGTLPCGYAGNETIICCCSI